MDCPEGSYPVGGGACEPFEDDAATGNDPGGDDEAPTDTPTTGVLALQNDTFVPVDELYAWPCERDDMGVNQLSNGADGCATSRVNDLPPGCWNAYAVSAVWTWEFSEMEIDAGDTFTWTLLDDDSLSQCDGSADTGPPPDAEFAALRVLNESSHTIGSVTLAPCGTSSFGGDLLDGTIAAGSSQAFEDLDPGCVIAHAEPTDADGFWESDEMELVGGTTRDWTLWD